MQYIAIQFWMYALFIDRSNREAIMFFNKNPHAAKKKIIAAFMNTDLPTPKGGRPMKDWMEDVFRLMKPERIKLKHSFEFVKFIPLIEPMHPI